MVSLGTGRQVRMNVTSLRMAFTLLAVMLGGNQIELLSLVVTYFSRAALSPLQ